MGNILFGPHLNDTSKAGEPMFDVEGRCVDRTYEFMVGDPEFGNILAAQSVLFESKKDGVPKAELGDALSTVIKDVINNHSKGQIEISVCVYYVLSWDKNKYNFKRIRIVPEMLNMLRSRSDDVTMILNSSQNLRDLTAYYYELDSRSLDQLVEAYYNDQKAKAGMFSWMMRDTYINDLLMKKLVAMYTD